MLVYDSLSSSFPVGNPYIPHTGSIAPGLWKTIGAFKWQAFVYWKLVYNCAVVWGNIYLGILSFISLL